MHLGKTLLAASAFMAALVVAAPAMAETANTNVNVRQWAGGPVVDVMLRGESARIVGRQGGWCEVDRPRSPDGFVACQYLDDDDDGDFDDDFDDDFGDRDRGRGRDRDRDPEPDVSISFSVPGFSFSIGEGGFDGRPGRPGRPGRGDQICFYEHVNFNGARFCARPGERLRALGQWNDRISSIRVFGDAEALACEHNNFRGRCVTIDRSVRNLGRRGNDIISSIRVR